MRSRGAEWTNGLEPMSLGSSPRVVGAGLSAAIALKTAEYNVKVDELLCSDDFCNRELSWLVYSQSPPHRHS